MGYYSSGCDDIIPAPNCDPCATKEFGRIGSFGFVRSDYIDTILADPSQRALWDAGMAAADPTVFLFPYAHGELAEPSEQVGSGYGRQVETFLGYDFNATVYDPNYKDNCDFWNAIKRSKNYYFAYFTSSQVHLTPVAVTVIPKAPIADDLTSEVVWKATVKWRHEDHPCPYDAPDGLLDQCFIPS